MVPVLGVLRQQTKSRKPLDERSYGDLALEACERRSKAEVDALGKAQVAVVGPADVKPIRFIVVSWPAMNNRTVIIRSSFSSSRSP